jgi:hypothetical protein
MNTLYHRLPILHPGLRRIGVGWTKVGDGTTFWVMDAGTGIERARVLVYPADNQHGVPLAFDRSQDEPDPLPEAPGRATGYPITATFAPGSQVRTMSATLTEEGGAEVPFTLLTPERLPPARARYNTVCLLPAKPLKAGTVYTVSLNVTVNGQAWQRTWSFATQADK